MPTLRDLRAKPGFKKLTPDRQSAVEQKFLAKFPDAKPSENIFAGLGRGLATSAREQADPILRIASTAPENVLASAVTGRNPLSSSIEQNIEGLEATRSNADLARRTSTKTGQLVGEIVGGLPAFVVGGVAGRAALAPLSKTSIAVGLAKKFSTATKGRLALASLVGGVEAVRPPEEGQSRLTNSMLGASAAFALTVATSVVGKGAGKVFKAVGADKPIQKLLNTPISETIGKVVDPVAAGVTKVFPKLEGGFQKFQSGLAQAGLRSSLDFARRDPVALEVAQGAIKAEDTARRISSRFGTTIGKIYKRNNITAGDGALIQQMDVEAAEGSLPRMMSALRSKLADDPVRLQRLTTFINERKRFVTDPLAKLLNLPADRTLSFYATRIIDPEAVGEETSKQIMRELSRVNGLPKELADAVAKGSLPEVRTAIRSIIPKEATFGPVSFKRQTDLPIAKIPLFQVDQYYIQGASRKAALDRFLPGATERLDRIADPTVKKLYTTLVDDVRGVPRGEEWQRQLAQAEGAFQFVSKIGFNAASAAVNATQPFINTIPKLVGKGGLGGFADFSSGVAQFFSQRGKRMLIRAGVRDQLTKGEFEVSEKASRKLLGKVTEASGFMFSAVERFNRGVTFLAQAQQTKRLGGKIPEAVEAGKRLVSETQFSFDKAARLGIANNPIGRTVLRFKLFTINQLEFLKNLTPKEAIVFVGMADLIGGPDALPMVERMRAELNASHPNAILTRFLNAAQKHSLADAVGVNLSGRLGTGEFPGIRGAARGDLGASLVDLLGPTAGDASRGVREFQKTGSVASAAFAAREPVFLRRIRRPTSQSFAATRSEENAAEGVLRGIGFEPLSSANRRREQDVEKRQALQERQAGERERRKDEGFLP